MHIYILVDIYTYVCTYTDINRCQRQYARNRVTDANSQKVSSTLLENSKNTQ